MEITALQTPVQVDTAIAEQLFIHAKAEREVEIQERYLNGDAYTRHFFDEEKYGEALARLDEATGTLNELQALYTGWSRYYHVTNNNGHIHTGTHCTSCFPDTQYSWRTDLSGLTPEQVVERESYNACSVCMPIAPAEQRAARERYDAAQRAARKAEKDAKAAEKARKAAERARKLMVKVDAWYESQGGYAAVMSWDSHRVYRATIELPSTTGNVIYDDWHAEHDPHFHRFNRNPREIIADAKGI